MQESCVLVNLKEEDVVASQKTASSLVQITASNQEIERRISAFMERKRNEINQQNIRDFCGILTPEAEHGGCARTAAIFVPHAGCKNNYKVSKVHNHHGPQTQQKYATCTSPLSTSDAIESRLRTVETHLGLHNAAVRTDIHNRLKLIEDRILQLEGSSPEYFNHMNFPLPGMSSDSSQNINMAIDQQRSHDPSLSEIDSKIRQLRAGLKRRDSHRFEAVPP